jgi:methionine-gamma-lyase
MNDRLDRGATNGFATRAVQAGRQDLREAGLHVPPIDLSATYPLTDVDEDAKAYDRWAEGQSTASNPIYARFSSTSAARLEQGLAQLEGAEAAVAFASGMAAVTACLMAVCREQRHVVAIRPLYGGTDHLLDSGLLGLEVTWAEAGEVAAAVRPDTGLVVVENPQNPTLSVVDLGEVVAGAGEVPVLVDNTFATPVLQNPLAHGASLSLHSASKFLGGHNDVIGGIVAADEQQAQKLRQVRMYTGAVLHPLAAYLLHRGLSTLPLRVERAQATAEVLAGQLLDHPAVERVHYPGLTEPLPPQMRGPGALLAFELGGGSAAARRFVRHLRVANHAVSLGGIDTLVQHPASFSHRLMDPETQAAAGISQGLVRVSVGLEDPGDLWDDLDQALAQSSDPSPATLAQTSE